MRKLFKIPLVLEPQKEGGWTITSPILPELITEVDDIKQLDEVVRDAISAVVELYEDIGKEFPPDLIADGIKSPVWFESLIFTGT
ncbi:MAG: type II toxin-antitoxin system HicB family antitoxin [Nitrospinota bacterium]|jgi:antitoxin HicB